MKNIAIILAGGNSKRFGGDIPKQFIMLEGKRIIDYSINTFKNNKDISDIVIVCEASWITTIKNEYPDCNIVNGGKSRKESSYNGLKACPKDTENVLIHDSARPFISADIISRCIEALTNYKAVNTVIPAVDTIVEIKNKYISNIPIRDYMFLAQTPQGFNFDIINKAHNTFQEETTDDISLVKKLGIKCYSIKGSVYNFKLTNSMDMYLAEKIVSNQHESK